MTFVNMKWHDANFDYVFRSWEGPVGRYLLRRGTLLKMWGIGEAGLRTGALKASIGLYQTRRGKALELRIGANPRPGGKVGYGIFHHEGTGPHVITPRNPGGHLVFKVQGRTVITRKVNHPGNRANPYMTRHLGRAFP